MVRNGQEQLALVEIGVPNEAECSASRSVDPNLLQLQFH